MDHGGQQRRTMEPLARVPWIRRQGRNEVELGESEYFQKVLACESGEGDLRIDLYRLLNDIFPFYLPERYHTMDIWNLHCNSQSIDFWYWQNAVQFLFCNQAHGNLFYHSLVEEIKKESPDISGHKAAFSPNIKDFYSNDHVEQCSSAEEFLLEPWVLIQLPFQPVLMNQWAVALFAETLKFLEECGELFYVKLPQPLNSTVEKLKTMVEKLINISCHFLSYFSVYVRDATDNLHIILSDIYESFLVDLPEVLPIVEFLVVNDLSRNMVKALKRMAFDPPRLAICDIKEKRKSYSNFQFSFMYNYDFWIEKTHIRERILDFERKPSTKQQEKRENKITLSQRQNLKKLIDEKLITTGVLRGARKEVILKAVDLAIDYLMPHFQEYETYKGTSSSSPGIKDHDYGVIFQLITLYSDVKISEALNNMTTILSSFDKKSPFRKICRHSVGCEGKDFGLKEIDEQLLATLELSSSRDWKYERFLRLAKKTCFSPERKSSPDYGMTLKEIADHFQERIKNLVIKMIERQFKSSSTSCFHFYPECQFVQYILPCFAATFLDLCKRTTETVETKKNYLNFVHQLVESYENYEFSQELKSIEQKVSFSCTTYVGCFKKQIAEYEINTTEDFQQVAGPNQVTQKIFHCLHFFKQYTEFYFSHRRAVNYISFPWQTQMLMFFSRINSTFETLGVRDNSCPFKALIWMNDLCAMHARRYGDEFVPLFSYRIERNLRDINNPEKYFSESERILLEKQRFEITPILLADSYDLTVQQLVGLSLFYYSKNRDIFSKIGKVGLQGPGFLLDPSDAIAWSFWTEDRWLVKMKLFKKVENFRSKLNDLTLVSLECAKKNSCYKDVPQYITLKGKVKMDHAGEITFFPVKHCRWCGLVETVDASFRVCAECAENPDYPDINFFCSAKCEMESLKIQHEDEHARFLMIKCGIIQM